MKLSEEELSSKQLGADTLKSAVQQIQLNGYVVLESVLSKDYVANLHDTFMETFTRHVQQSETNRGKNRHQMFLPFTEPFIDPDIITHPFVLTIVEQLLGERCTCRYFASDTPLPGSDYQAVHSDLGPLFPEANITVPVSGIVLNIPLVDFREDNGPLEIWPGGTHLIPESLNRPEYIQAAAASMTSIPVLMPAGSLLLRDIRMWHRGTPNRSGAARPNLALVYYRSWFHSHPQIDIPKTVYDGLSERAQRLFRLEHIHE